METQEKIEMQLTARDFVNLNFAFLNRNGTVWVLLIAGIGFFFNFIYQVSIGGSFGSYAFSLFFSLFSFLLPILTYRGAKRSFQNKFAQEAKTYRFTSEGFMMESASITSKVQWSDVQRVITSKHGIYLMISSNAAHIFPERYLAGHERIRSMMMQRVTPKSVARGKSKLLLNLLIYLAIFLVTVGIVQFFLAE